MIGKTPRANTVGADVRAQVASAATAPRGGVPRGLRPVLIALGALVAAVAIVASLMAAQASTADQGAESVRQAVLSAAMQCCAVEGSYPSTIEHLEEHYGLAVNHSDYVILYEAFASNVVPSVTVVPR